VANYGAGTISALLGKGDGTFQPPISSTVTSSYAPFSLTAGDFNGDGKPDLIVIVINTGPPWYTNSAISVLLGNGDGTFKPAFNYASDLAPQSVAVGDFNGDGKPDLAVANYGSSGPAFTNGSVSLLMGNGDGTFQAAVNYAAGLNPISVAVSDFNGDGKLDLVVANSGSTNTSVLLGNGDGTFRPAVSYGAETAPYSVASGDFNGDGKLDLVVANFGNPYSLTPIGGSISILLGNGDGTFQAAVNYAAGLGPQFVVVGDFNGDGKLDLAVANNGRHPSNDTKGSVSVLLGNGDGTFQSAVNYNAGWAPAFLAVADFNGDGKPDLTVNGVGTFDLELIGGPVEVLLNTCPCAGVHLDAAQNKKSITLSWPLPYTNFVLECTSNLNSTNWQPVVGTLATSNGHCETIVPLNQAPCYFRLRKR
jgi:uncharacterized protein (UPF0548 family)